MKIYIAGPMRGIPAYNFPAFDAADATLKALGHVTFNPADRDRAVGFDTAGLTGNENLSDQGFDLREALQADTEWISLHADAVALLPGWEKSTGAMAEVALARALGLPVGLIQTFDREGCTHLPTDLKPSGEIRTTSSTGGEKGAKPERYDLIPVGALATVARLYGRGAKKYAAHNWRKGYEWSKSYAALQRHATQFWNGEDVDAEMELPHLAAVAFHALTLLTFMEEQRAFDDRYHPQS